LACGGEDLLPAGAQQWGLLVKQQSCDTALNPAATLLKSLKPDFGSNARNPRAREPHGYMSTFLSLNGSPVTQQDPSLR